MSNKTGVSGINRINCLKQIKLMFNNATKFFENQVLEIGEDKWEKLVESNAEFSRQLKELMELEQKIDDQLEAMHKDLSEIPETDWDAKYPNIKDQAGVIYTLTLDFA